MKVFLFVFLFTTLLLNNLRSQSVMEDLGSYKKNFMEGSLLLEEDNKMMALQAFKNAYKYDSLNSNINYLIGLCYLAHPKLKHEAESYLEKAIAKTSKNYLPLEPSEKSAPVIAYFYLAQSYHLDYKFDRAEKMLDTYESFLKDKEKTAKADVEYFKERIKWAKAYKAAPQEVKITNMGDSINDAMPDYSPVISADERTLIFTHRGKNNVGYGELAIDGYPYEDIMISYRKDNGDWTSPKSISPYINTSGHDGSVGLTPDGQTLIIYKDENGGDLYYSQFDGKEWGIPVKFGSNINTQYWEPSACLSRDGNALYFVSDRPGGLGGRDIYRCVKLPNGQWSLATNLGPNINTPYDEESPFLSADGITFYFSSKGHQSMGGFDIMMSIIDPDGKFSSPMNLEYPINSTDDDLYLVATPDNRRFYYASAHEDPNAFGEKDIYKITYDAGRSNPLALFKGQIKPGPCDSLPTDISVLVTNKNTGEVVGTYRPQHTTGTFAVILTPGSVYTFIYQQDGTDLFSEDIDVSSDIAYDEIQKDLKLKPHNLCNGAIMDYDSTKATEQVLELVILNNKKENKGVGNIGFKIYTKDGLYYQDKTEADGKHGKILLEKNHNYDIVLDDFPKVKEHFTTIGVEGGKKFIKTLYLDNSLFDVKSQIQLNVSVLSSKKTKKPINGATLKLTGTDGSSQDFVANSKGQVKNINLSAETNYELIAESNGTTSTKYLVTTHGIRGAKTIAKTLYLSGNENQEIPDNSHVNGDNFKFYFKYNMNEIDEQAPEYVAFIDKLVAIKNAKGKVKLNVTASASKVPTKTYNSNEELSAKRVKAAELKVINSLKARGLNEADIEVVKESSIVTGPSFNSDADNTKKYEKYQYVSIQGY